MKRIGFLIFLGTLFSFFNHIYAQSVTVIDPNGGELLGGCTNYTIRWDAQNTSGYFSIDFSTDNALNWTSVASGLYLPGNGQKTFTWSVPNVNSNLCRVRVVDTYASATRDSSNATFTISEAMRILVPNGGEVWAGLSNQAVAWNNNSSSTNWRLDYSTNSGVSWNIINSSYTNASGNYTWNVNHTPSTTCKFRVTSTSNSCITDMTDGLFTITEVPPVLTTPNGGESWWSLDSYNITWNSSSVLSSTVRLEYSTNSGTTWNLIIANTANNGSYNWSIPFAPSNTALVKLTETANPTRKDSSNAVFTINKPVIVGYPNGGQNLVGCSNVTVSGSKASNCTYVKVEYTTNNGSSWNLIGTTAYSTSNSWSMSWTVPSANSSQCRIRASNNYDPLQYDESDVNFTITTNNELTLQQPNGGQVWTSLNTYAINWFAGPLVPSTISIQYSTNNGSTWNAIASVSTAAGTYNWTLPNLSSTQCLIRLVGNSCHTDQSDAVFTINPVKPVITTPNGGEQWWSTDPNYIYWNANTILNGSNVRLEYSTNSGAAWNVIVGSTSGASGQYNWNPVPFTPSSTSLVRLLEVSDTTRKDTSNAVFTIRKPVLVGTPNGGQSYLGCDVVTVSGTKASNCTYVKVEYTTNNGASWISIGTTSYSTSNSWSMSWTVPNVTSSQCRIRASNNYDPLQYDESDVNFTIGINNQLTLLQPNGGQVWTSLGTYQISWSAGPTVPSTVSLLYSTNNGSTWNSIAGGISTTGGSYNWTLPNISSTQCLVRVQAGGCHIDQSDAVFTINPVMPVITTPNGGEQWWSTDPNYIYWNANTILNGSNVRLEYSTNSGAAWNVIIGSTSGTSGQYYWNPVPFTPSNTSLVRLLEVSDTTRKDTSNAVFTIRKPVLVSTPNGGQSYLGCDVVTVSGAKASNCTYVKAEYTTNNGASWILIGTTSYSTSNSWSMSWTVPNVNSSQCRIRASNNYDPLQYDESDANFTIGINNQLTLIQPNGGQVWTSLGTYQITWLAGPTVPATVSLYYSTNNGSSWNAINNVSTATGFYNWTLPNINSTQCLVRVQAGGCHTDQSDAVFTVTPVMPVITTPNGGEQWWSTDPNYIYWNANTILNGSNVRLEYSTNSGAGWNVIVGSTSGTSGQYYWNPVPFTPSNTSLVRLLEVSDTTRKDTSNAVFTIRKPVLVGTPNGGQSYLGCDVVTVSGTKANNCTYVKVEYTTNNGSSWNPIGTTSYSTSNSWSMSWTVPNVTSSQCRIRASNNYDPLQYDESDANFSIGINNQLTLQQPNGGQVWTSLGTYQITWLAGPTVPATVSLLYSTNNGSTWNSITSVSTATGFYNWTLPNIGSTQCLVRVQAGGCHTDQSDAVFTVNPVKPVITTPNGGEQWWSTDPNYIYWNANTILNGSNVRLEYSTNSGAGWNVIVGSTSGASGQYYWNPVPFTPSSTSLVRLLEVSDTTRKDTSNAVFTIRKPVLVGTPNGGQSYLGCDVVTVSGTKANNCTYVKVEYTTNNGASWMLIGTTAYSTSNFWSMSWTVPNMNSSQCRIRASNNYDPLQYDESDVNFSIGINNQLTLQQPNGGQVWTSLGTYQISWLAGPSVPATVSLLYSTNNGSTWNSINTANTATGFYNWTLPNISSTQCLIRVQGSSCHIDQSDAVFTINPVKPIITSPNGSEVWYNGQSRNVTWNASSILNSSNVRLEYSTNNGSTWNVVVGSTAGTSGSYSWMVPNTPSSLALVRLIEVLNTSRSDTSDAVFDIRPAITVVSPNGNTGNENFRGCTITSLTWNHSPDITRFNLDYTTNNGTTWINIATNYNAPGTSATYNWTIPNTPTSQARVRVSDYYSAVPSDMSDNMFAITQPVVLTQPTYGGVLQAGGVHNITWVSDGISNFYNLDYSTDGGSTWINIITNYNTSTYVYAWTVPNTPSANCKVRVTDYLNSCKWDISDATFSINNLPAAITVLQPNGYDTTNACGSRLITWNATGTSGTYNIDFSTNGGVTWTPIVANYTTGTNSYTWNYGNLNSNYCLIRVVDAADANKRDQSDAAFAIESVQVIASGDTSVCAGIPVPLSASGGSTYTWTPAAGLSNPNIASPTATPAVSTTYRVTSQVGTCTLTDSVTVLVQSRPTLSASGPLTICQGSSVNLTSSKPTGNTWNTGATTATITATASGNYFVSNTTGGCTLNSDTLTLNVVVPTTPTISAGGPTTFCQGGNVVLTSSLPSGNLWSTGATTSSITVSSSGSYTVAESNVCATQSTPTTVTVNAPPATPTITASGPTNICLGDTVTLVSSAPTGNTWSNGSTAASINVSTTGVFSVTQTNAFGCTASSTPVSVIVSQNSNPSITALGATTFCQGDSVVLASNLSSNMLWSNGATTPSIIVRNSGTYQVFDQTGCGGTSNTITVTVNAGPATPTITPSGSTTFCQGDSVTLTASPATSYLWSNGATTSSITVSTSGNYSVEVTGAGGCRSNSAPTAVTVNTGSTPTISPSGPTTFCQGGNVTLAASPGSGFIWSNGATTQSINVANAGSYTVTVTTANGCVGTSNAQAVVVNSLPATPVITPNAPTTFCQGGDVILTSSYAAGNLWNTSASSASITVNTSGSYTVTHTDANGCAATSAPTSVTVNPAPSTPTVTANGPTTFCQGGSVTLDAPAASSYLWSNGATTQSINVSSTGSYTVTVSNAGGCTAASTPTVVTVNAAPSTPTLTPSGPTTFCQGDNVILTASASSSYLWSNGATTQSITVTTSGSYSVTVSNAGCSAASTPTTVTVNAAPSTPAVTANGPTTFCQGGSVTLDAPVASSYLWSNGATTQSITVSNAGSYTVTVSNAGGCTAASAPTVVTVNAAPGTPTLTPSGSTTFCQGSSVILTASASSSYLWSTGATTQSITVTTSGSYSVTVSNAGCSAASTPTTVTVNAAPSTPAVTASGPTTFCQGGSVTLDAPVASSYLWSNGATTQSITVSNAGSYTVTVSNAGGCTAASAPTVVTVNAAPGTPTLTPSGSTTFCQGSSVILTASASSSYLWSTGATTQSITVTTSGSYSVTVSNAGCSAASAPTTVTVNAAPSTPVVTANGPTTFCQGGSVTLDAPVASSYLWSNGATTQSITVNNAGSYTVTVSNAGGCTAASAPTVVTVNAAPAATISPSGPTAFCQGGSVSLSASPGASFLWSNGATTQSITVNSAGSYTVTVTGVNGCDAVSNAQAVVVNALPAAPVVSPSGPTSFCQGGSVSLSSSYATGNVWSPTNATTPNITVSSTGTYSVTHTDANGCSSSSAPITVTVTTGASTPTITSSGATTFCQGDSVVLTASAASSYAWSNGATTQSVSVQNTGSYSVTITDAGGCTAASAVTAVTVNAVPATPSITAGGSTTICDGESVTLTSSSPVDNVWSPTAATTQSIQATVAGNYVVTVTNAAGCSAQSAPVTVNVLPLPSVPVITQSGGDLVSTSANSYQWYLNGNIIPGATSQTYSPTVSGNYTVEITGPNGCSNTSASFSYVFVGAEEAGAGDWLQVYPNPNHGKFTLEMEFGQLTNADARIVDMNGKIVWRDTLKDHQGIYRRQVDLEGFAKGVYILQVLTDTGREYSERIVTQ